MNDWILGDLVTGANGFVSRPLCAERLWQRRAVRGAVRSENTWNDDFERVIVGSINKGALEGDLAASKNKTCAVDLNEMRAVWSQRSLCNGLNLGRFLMTEISVQETTKLEFNLIHQLLIIKTVGNIQFPLAFCPQISCCRKN